MNNFENEQHKLSEKILEIENTGIDDKNIKQYSIFIKEWNRLQELIEYEQWKRNQAI